MISILIIFLEIWDKTTFETNCKGGISYYHGDDDRHEIKYSTNNVETDGDGSYLEGSFCPTLNVNQVTVGGYADKFEYWVSTNSNNDSHSSSKSRSWPHYDWNSVTYGGPFYKNRCYHFIVKITDEFDGYTDKMYFQADGVYLDSTNAFNCNYNDCKPNHYGATCEGPVESSADKCTVSLGVYGTGKCLSCMDASTVQSHCRKVNGVALSNQKLLLQTKLFDGNWSTGTAEYPISYTTNDGYYNSYNFSGYVIVPTTSTVSFRLTSYTPATLKVNSVLNGTLSQSDLVFCNPHNSQIERTLSYTGDIRPVPIEIIFNSGCSINKVDVELKWNIGSGYVPIPQKYLYYS